MAAGNAIRDVLSRPASDSSSTFGSGNLPHRLGAAFRPLRHRAGLLVEPHRQFEVAERGWRPRALRDRLPPRGIVCGLRRNTARPDVEAGALGSVLAQEVVLAYKLRVGAPAGNCRTCLGEDRIPVGARRRARKPASGPRMNDGTRRIAGSPNRLRRKGWTASSESGPPRLNRMIAIFTCIPSCKPRVGRTYGSVRVCPSDRDGNHARVGA